MSQPTDTLMYAEAAQASVAVARQLRANASLMRELADRLRGIDPPMMFTCARGSSDHAATFAKYLFETRLRVPTLSQAPSIASVYRSEVRHMRGLPFLVVSQSGRSPDLLLSAEAARKAGALVIAFVNDMASPLAQMAEIAVPLHAGAEQSVAATKSYLATLSAFAQLTALWSADGAMTDAVDALPLALDTAWRADWSPGVELFADAVNMFVLGRGLTLGIAHEAALKFKETCAIHAEAFSSAEVAHGPMALVKPAFPLLVFRPLDEAAAGLADLVERFRARGAHVLIAGEELPLRQGLHGTVAPIAMAQSFYAMANALAVRRGLDPDNPPLLRKVTTTR